MSEVSRLTLHGDGVLRSQPWVSGSFLSRATGTTPSVLTDVRLPGHSVDSAFWLGEHLAASAPRGPGPARPRGDVDPPGPMATPTFGGCARVRSAAVPFPAPPAVRCGPATFLASVSSDGQLPRGRRPFSLTVESRGSLQVTEPCECHRALSSAVLGPFLSGRGCAHSRRSERVSGQSWAHSLHSQGGRARCAAAQLSSLEVAAGIQRAMVSGKEGVLLSASCVPVSSWVWDSGKYRAQGRLGLDWLGPCLSPFSADRLE